MATREQIEALKIDENVFELAEDTELEYLRVGIPCAFCSPIYRWRQMHGSQGNCFCTAQSDARRCPLYASDRGEQRIIQEDGRIGESQL